MVATAPAFEFRDSLLYAKALGMIRALAVSVNTTAMATIAQRPWIKRAGASAGVGFAVPVDVVNRVVQKLIAQSGRRASLFNVGWPGARGRSLSLESR